MTAVSRYGREMSTVFDLLGTHEPALTAALGWTLARSPNLLAQLLARVCDASPLEPTTVLLESADADGRTDVEIQTGSAHIIIEAKQGWIVPSEVQLGRYASRFSHDRLPVLVTVSDSTSAWAGQVLPASVDGVPVKHLAWDDVRALVRAAMGSTSGTERLWLRQLEEYMGDATAQRPASDSLAYCVVVSDEIFGGYPFRDYVQRQRVYFHPFATGGWPSVPPNFLAFRWGNAVRQLNRVTNVEVVGALGERFASVTPDESDEPHVVYRLGPDIPLPPDGVPSGRNLRNTRLWVLVDQLLTQPTVIEAQAESTRLLEQTLPGQVPPG